MGHVTHKVTATSDLTMTAEKFCFGIKFERKKGALFPQLRFDGWGRGGQSLNTKWISGINFPRVTQLTHQRMQVLIAFCERDLPQGKHRMGTRSLRDPVRGPLLQYLSFREQQVSMLCLWWVALGLATIYGRYNKEERDTCGTAAPPSRHATELSGRMDPPLTFLLISPLHLHVSPSYHPSLLTRLIHCAAVFEVGHQKPWKLFPSCIVHLFILLFFIMHSLLHVSPKCPNGFV